MNMEFETLTLEARDLDQDGPNHGPERSSYAANSRACGSNPRSLGTNLRALGTNPRARARNKWALRQWKRRQQPAKEGRP